MCNSLSDPDQFIQCHHIDEHVRNNTYIVPLQDPGFYHQFESIKGNTDGNHHYLWSIESANGDRIMISYKFQILYGNVINISTHIQINETHAIVIVSRELIITNGVTSSAEPHLFGYIIHHGQRNGELFRVSRSILNNTIHIGHISYNNDASMFELLLHWLPQLSDVQIFNNAFDKIHINITLEEFRNFDKKIFEHGKHHFLHLNFFDNKFIPTDAVLKRICLPNIVHQFDPHLAEIQFVDIPIEII
jgi:hypothetical protein